MTTAILHVLIEALPLYLISAGRLRDFAGKDASRWVSSMVTERDALGAHDADLEPFTAPGQTVGSAQLMPQRSVVHGEQAERGVLGAELGQRGVHRSGVDLHGGLALHQPQAHVETVRARRRPWA